MCKKIKQIFLVCVLILGVTGCSNVNEKIKIAVIVKSTTSQFFKSVYSGVKAASKEYNLEITFNGPENEEDYQSQIEMIDQAIDHKVDAIVLSAINYNQLVDSVERAIKDGIEVIVIDSDVNSKYVDTRIGTNNYQAGKMSAETVLKLIDQKISVGIVNFDVNTANGQERERGLRDCLKHEKRVINIDTINVPSDIDSSIEATENILKSHPNINVIVTFNEWTTLGVGQAIEKLGYQDQVAVIGFDNNPISIEMLESGTVDALIVQSPFTMGYLGVEQAYHLVRNQKAKEGTLYTKTIVITRDNMFDKGNQKIVFPFD